LTVTDNEHEIRVIVEALELSTRLKRGTNARKFFEVWASTLGEESDVFELLIKDPDQQVAPQGARLRLEDGQSGDYPGPCG
jgi:hypothetical protein